MEKTGVDKTGGEYNGGGETGGKRPWGKLRVTTKFSDTPASRICEHQ